jgi:hypothetical protein
MFSSLLMLPVGLLLIASVSLGGLNYAGVCTSRLHMLTDQEKIIAAVTYANAASAIYITTPSQQNGSTHYETKLYTPIPYKDATAFLAENQHCCHITTGQGGRRPEDPPAPDTFARILGLYAGDVNISYTAHYVDENGKAQYAPYNTMITLGNCGQYIHD